MTTSMVVEFLPGRPPSSYPLSEQPPKTFAPTQPTPEDLPLPLSPHAPKLDALDVGCKNSTQPRIEELEAEGVCDHRNMDATSKFLEKYQDERVGRVLLASQRLQAVLGLRSERPFDLEPRKGNVEYAQVKYESGNGPVRSVKGDAKALEILGRSFVASPLGFMEGIELFSSAKEGTKLSRGCLEPASSRVFESHHISDEAANIVSTSRLPPPANRIEALFRHNIFSQIISERQYSIPQTYYNQPPESTASPDPQVNRHTGAGLRAFLRKQTEFGLVRKRECDSITFCDFTPDMNTDQFNNQMLGHWTAELQKGERIEVYEVELYISLPIFRVSTDSFTVQR